jgi:hypothetical protein
MVEMARITTQWTGFTGAPGYTVMHFRDFGGTDVTPPDAQMAVDRVYAFFNAVKAYFPQQVSLQVRGEVEAIDEATGNLQDVIVATAPAAIVGTAGTTVPYAAALGSVVSWRTGVVRNNRRIRGRTFLVPLSSLAFDNTGTLIPGALTAFNTAATALRDATTIADFGIYARPTAPGASDGVWALVTGHQVPDMGSVLRSRRD